MPVIKSAIKKLKQSLKHQAHNRSVKKSVKELIDTFKKSPTAKAYSEAVSALDKAAKINAIHKNKANRLKSRLAKKMPRTEAKVEKAEKVLKKVSSKKPKTSKKA